MDNKTNCGFSLGRPRFGSTQQEDQAEDDAKSMVLKEEDDDDGAKSTDLEGDMEEEKHACGKSFTSGKALDGNRRIHMRTKMVGRYVRGEFEVDCCVCHKKFTSMKALYGHMRFHPDRGWKGVLPPPHHHHPLGNLSSSTISTDDDDRDHDDHWELGNVVDLKESIKGRWTTGKRGRRSALKDDIDAENLLFLATTAESVTSDSNSDQEMTKKSKKTNKNLSEVEKEPSTTHDQLEVVVVGGGGDDEEGGGVAREKHVCVTCNKSFNSYQALGGHRASHNKVKILENHNQARANGEALLLGTEAMINGLASGQGPNTSLSTNGDHVCDKCHKSFPTGQALGGHKRRHWTGPVSSEAATAVPTAATASVQEVKKTTRMLMDFDLNELPPNEE